MGFNGIFVGFLWDFCENFNVPQRTLIDIRDGETYRVRKLADGNVWMTENLRLEFDGTSATGLTVANTNITSEQYNTDTNSDGNNDMLVISATQSRNGTTTQAEMDEWAGSGTDQQKAERWLSRSAKKIEGSKVVWATESSPNPGYYSNTNYTKEDQKFGVYYNFYTATGGNGKWLNTQVIVNTQFSICPNNWHMPGFQNNISWDNLISTTYNIPTGSSVIASVNLLNATPFSIPFSGLIYFSNGDFSAQGYGGRFFSATYNSQGSMYYFDMYGSSLNPHSSHNTRNGFSVRCVSK